MIPARSNRRGVEERTQSKALRASLLSIFGILAIAILIIGFNGGIGVGWRNHVGQLPVARRVLDPGYLAGDFGIELRQYHLRFFSYLIAAGSAALGEDNALILLHVIGMTLLAGSLWRLCQALRLPLSGFAVVGLLLATNLLGTGKGLEENHLVGDAAIMPPTFAHAFVLLSVASVLEDRYRLAALFAGLAALFHLQIGAICLLMIAPFYLVRLTRLGVKEMLLLMALFAAPAAAAVSDFLRMLAHGILSAPSSEHSLAFYIDFRHPHHFELRSAAAAILVGAHLLIQLAAYLFLRHAKHPSAPRVGKLAMMSLTLVALAILHFGDYYLLKSARVSVMQFIRLSPLITAFGTSCLVVGIYACVESKARAPVAALVKVALILTVASWCVYEGTRPHAAFHLGVIRYADSSSSWVVMCRWIRANAPRDTVYVTPPGHDGFVSLSDRSNVADFKNNPDGALHLGEWLERLQDLAGGELPRGHGFENRRLLNKAYASLGAKQLIEVGKKYGATYAVLPAASTADLEVVHRNERFRLVKLPSNP